jgi:putative ATP-dependent endonuclease of the OLD family
MQTECLTMKLRRIGLENVRSFLEPQELELRGDISIIIGPNGGGKTNLLDTAVLALRQFLLKSWIPRHNPVPEWQDRYEWIANDAIQPHLLEKHSRSGSTQQKIELDVEVTQPDLDNITQTKRDAPTLRERAKSRYASFPGQQAASWDTDGLEAGQVFRYTIIDGRPQSAPSPQAETFRLYLETFEIERRLREENEQAPLSMPMIALPVSRSSGELPASISLASFDDFTLKREVDAATSRSTGSISKFAVGRLATRYRTILERDTGQAKAEFNNDPSIQVFTATLKSLGYDWRLVCTNPIKNQYEIELSKQGSAFRLGAASSGERELLTYLFAIYALNIRNALIVVDEPELHLHPRWQQILLGLFERLSSETANQFLMATHSPVFVSPSSIQYVSRVYSDQQQSRIVRLSDGSLPDTKHLFSIVNSQNNERVFFADLVILVEGISDRIFFEALLRHFSIGAGTGRVYEVVSVGGKGLFTQYERLMRACQVPHVLVADLDYVRELGGAALRGLFSVSMQSVQKDVIDNTGSLDGQALAGRLDEAIASGSLNDLRALWDYIKARQIRLRTDLTSEEQQALVTFIENQQNEGRFILSKGALEAYLPTGYKGKDIEKVIRLVAQPDFWTLLPETKAELEEYIRKIQPFMS